MPRRRKAIPTTHEGRASLASILEKCSSETLDLAAMLRKPRSLIKHDGIHDACESLQSAAQTLSDLSVGLSLGRIDVLQTEGTVEVQMPLFDMMQTAQEN